MTRGGLLLAGRVTAGAAALATLGAGLLCASEARHVASIPALQAAMEYHFGAEHHGLDWAYRTRGAYVAHGAISTVVLLGSAACLGRFAATGRFRSLAVGLVGLAVLVAETVARRVLGE